MKEMVHHNKTIELILDFFHDQIKFVLDIGGGGSGQAGQKNGNGRDGTEGGSGAVYRWSWG
jgi:hypothetical protein